MKKDNIAKCPKCNADIDYLQAFCFEQNKYRVHLDNGRTRHRLEWSVSEVVESSETKIEFTCPECNEILFTTRDGVIDFLSKGL